MKKVMFSAAVALAALLSTNSVKAGTFVDGDFSARSFMGGYYLDCADSKAYCGFVGWSGAYGRWYFMACDGTNYWLTNATYDPSEDLQAGLTVYGEPANKEDLPQDE